MIKTKLYALLALGSLAGLSGCNTGPTDAELQAQRAAEEAAARAEACKEERELIARGEPPPPQLAPGSSCD